jgi:hypothetical protein
MPAVNKASMLGAALAVLAFLCGGAGSAGVQGRLGKLGCDVTVLLTEAGAGEEDFATGVAGNFDSDRSDSFLRTDARSTSDNAAAGVLAREVGAAVSNVGTGAGELGTVLVRAVLDCSSSSGTANAVLTRKLGTVWAMSVDGGALL